MFTYPLDVFTRIKRKHSPCLDTVNHTDTQHAILMMSDEDLNMCLSCELSTGLDFVFEIRKDIFKFLVVVCNLTTLSSL